MMKRIIKFSFVLLVGAWIPATAQQEATYAQYMFNGLAVNPAYAGQHQALSATAVSRFQNVGLPGAATTQSFSIHSPLVNERFAVGALFVNDRLGVINQTVFSGIYAYRIPVSGGATLSFGIQGGISKYSAKYTQLDTYQTDPAFSQDIVEMRPNIGAGVYYSSMFGYIGLSMPQMLNNVFSRGVDFTSVKQSSPVILTAGYVFRISRAVYFKPNTLIKYSDGRFVEMDVNANFLFDKVLWLGVSYHSSNSLNFLFQAQLTDQIRIGYSYTTALGKISTVELGSHEIFLGYIFNFKNKGIVSPRYF